jgi:hypothetical protein
MHVKANGKQVVDMTLTLGLHGAWKAQIQANATVALTGAIELTIADSLTFVGTTDAGRAAEHLGRARARVTGGAAGLETAVAGKTYYQAPLRTILGELLAVGGETIATTTDEDLLATTPRHWARAAGTVRSEIDVLAERFAFSWRVLPDGTTWFGTETWDMCTLTAYTLLEDAREEGRVVIAAETPTVLPGETFLERHVDEVIHSLGRGGLRTEVRFSS